MFQFAFITRTEIARSPSARTMLNAIDYTYDDDYSKEAMIITGCPGSGKTTVITNRSKILTADRSSFQYLIFPRLLMTYIGNVLSEAGVDKSKVNTVHSWFWYLSNRTGFMDAGHIRYNHVKEVFERNKNKYKELIIDEGQDLWPELFELFPELCTKLTISCDNAQDVMDNFGSNEIDSEIKGILEQQNFNVRKWALKTNYRNTEQIYKFAKELVPEISTASIEEFHRTGTKPKVIVLPNEITMIERILNITNNYSTVNVGILCPSINQVRKIAKNLRDEGVTLSEYHSKMGYEEKKNNLDNLKNVVVTTHKSCKGLEFEVVIMPYANTFQFGMSTGPETLKGYYVACTRAKEELFVLSAYSVPGIIARFQNKNLFEYINR